MGKHKDGWERAVRIEELPAAIPPYCAHAMFRDQAYECVLENPGAPSALGRYSFLGIDPFWVLRGKRRECIGGPPGDLRPLPRDPLTELGELLARHRGDGAGWREGLPPLLGGALGYVGYELLYLLEDVPDLGRDDFVTPDLYLVCYHTVLATDGATGKSWLVCNGFGSSRAAAQDQVDRCMRDATARLAHWSPALAEQEDVVRHRWLARRDAARARHPRLTPERLAQTGVRPVMTRGEYLELVASAKRHIFAGDIFEVCTSQRLDLDVAHSGQDIYRIARSINPAPFAGYLRFPELEVASCSPERFMRLDRDRLAVTRPIKGTRPRGATPEADAELVRSLQDSEKDRAENLMIVDLARNDLGRVCEFGSVRVPELLAVETYPFNHQLVSTVHGRLRPDQVALDLLRAAFPGGSMTGAPKVEAMKIIDKLEPVKRGVFAGCIGYFDFDGAFDLSIVIRTLIMQQGHGTLHVGGAIVADSDPADEYQETLDKAHPLLLALELANTEVAS